MEYSFREGEEEQAERALSRSQRAMHKGVESRHSACLEPSLQHHIPGSKGRGLGKTNGICSEIPLSCRKELSKVEVASWQEELPGLDV